MRSLRPLDADTIFQSVRNTHHLVTVEQGWPQCGKWRINTKYLLRKVVLIFLG